MTSSSRQGIVTRFEGRICRVLADGVMLDCAARGLLFKDLGEYTHPVCAGDRVRVDWDGRTWVVSEVFPRRTLIGRSMAGKVPRIKPIAANVDQLIIIAAMKRPRLREGLIDRFLVCAERAGVKAVIVLNKIDLVHAEDVERTAANFGSCGYPVLATCAVDGRGVDEVRRVLAERTSVLAGPSGAGKSTLLNRVQPGLGLATGAVSARTNKGRHVTAAVTLIPLAMGGYVVDTPGVREFGLYDCAPEDLFEGFPEFAPFIGNCRFSDCAHIHEPDCAVKAAVERGDISAQRYGGYVRLRKSLEEGTH